MFSNLSWPFYFEWHFLPVSDRSPSVAFFFPLTPYYTNLFLIYYLRISYKYMIVRAQENINLMQYNWTIMAAPPGRMMIVLKKVIYAQSFAKVCSLCENESPAAADSLGWQLILSWDKFALNFLLCLLRPPSSMHRWQIKKWPLWKRFQCFICALSAK